MENRIERIQERGEWIGTARYTSVVREEVGSICFYLFVRNRYPGCVDLHESSIGVMINPDGLECAYPIGKVDVILDRERF